DRERRVDAHAQNRTLREVDLLTLRGGDRAATADHRTQHRAFAAAEDGTENGTDPRADACLANITPYALSFDRLRDGAAYGIRATVDRDLVEADGHLRGAIHTPRRLDGRDDAAHQRAGR